MQDSLARRSTSLGATMRRRRDFNKHNNFTTRAQELEKYCTELTKFIDEEKSKMQRQLSNLELSNNIDNELTTNNDNDNELPQEFCSFRIATYSLCFNAVHFNFVRISFSTKFVHYKLRNENEKSNELEKNFDTKSYNFRSQLQQQLPTVTFKKKEEQLDNLQNVANFYSFKDKVAEPLRSSASTTRCRFSLGRSADKTFPESFHRNMPGVQRIQLGSQLREAESTTNFQESSLTEDTFSKTASKTATWQKKPFDRQLLRHQLGRRDLQTGNFHDGSLTEETFSKTASKTATWKKRLSEGQLQRQQLGKGTLP